VKGEKMGKGVKGEKGKKGKKGVKGVKGMDVRSINDMAPEMEHDGTVAVWWLVAPREMKKITEGGFLELVSEFEVAGGSMVNPHKHPTHEFYYVTSGRGHRVISGKKRLIVPGDLVHIPPNAVHSLKPVSKHAGIHCFCFAVAVKGAPEIDYTSN
jgi:quercetin dioxygenase-like cupin family protein